MRGTMISENPGSHDDVITDFSISGPRINVGGPGQNRHTTFDSFSAFLEHQFAPFTFLSLSYNKQGYDFDSFDPRETAHQLRGDPNQLLPDGTPNPHAGELFLETRWFRRIRSEEAETAQLIGTHELDLEQWGRYRMAGFVEWYESERLNDRFNLNWAGAPFHNNPEHNRNVVWSRYYITEGDWESYRVTPPILHQNAFDPVTGETLTAAWISNSGMDSRPIESWAYMANVQGYFLDDRLVVGVGVREDELETRKFPGAVRDPETNIRYRDFSEYEVVETSGTTRTLGVVGHLTDWLSVIYNYSDNIALPSDNLILPDDGSPKGILPPTPEGIGTDIGFSFRLMDDRLVGRAMYFNNSSENLTGTRRAGQFRNHQQAYLDALLGEGLISDEEYIARDVELQNVTFDRESEGYELSITANPTENWRFILNYSHTDIVDSNIATEVIAWWTDEYAWVTQFDQGIETEDGDIAFEVGEIDFELLRVIGVDGVAALGSRPDKWSFFTRYDFSDTGPLRGLYLGGGFRYQSAMNIGLGTGGGFFNPDDGNPQLQKGNSFTRVDALMGYRTEILDDRPLRLQLNIYNLLDDEDPLIIRRTPEGNIQSWQIVDPMSFRLTASIEF